MSEILLDKIATKDKNGNKVVRDFTAMDAKIAALESGSSIKHATESEFGVIKLASNGAIDTGTDHESAVTPQGLTHALTPIKSKLDNITTGVSNFAYKDYTQPENQTEMEVGVQYLVPFNKSNQFLKLDPSTNAPDTDGQEEDVSDLEIAYYVKCIKDSSGKVDTSQRIYTQGHLENVAYTNKANTFEQLQTLSSGATITNTLNVDNISGSGTLNISGASTLADLTAVSVHGTGAATFDTTLNVSGAATFANTLSVTGVITGTAGADVSSGGASVPNAGNVKTFVEGYLPQVVSAIPESGSMVPGVLYLEAKTE